MAELGYCGDCGADLSGYELADLPDGGHGVACPDCGTDVYCGKCGNMTRETQPTETDQ